MQSDQRNGLTLDSNEQVQLLIDNKEGRNTDHHEVIQILGIRDHPRNYYAISGRPLSRLNPFPHMQNDCTFSPCRNYRYTLLHQWDQLFVRRRALFICLNPSTADENQLDPTLTRIKSFSDRLGANEFLMLNIFAYRATDPKDMMAVEDPIGPENDAHIQSAINEAYALNQGHLDIVGGWGNHGLHLDRQKNFLKILNPFRELPNLQIRCLGKNANATPKHPLYIAADRVFETL
jgi:hypothetical protein